MYIYSVISGQKPPRCPIGVERHDRMKMKTGLLDIIIDNKIDYKNMERHFNEEIDKLVKKEIGLL